MRVGAQQCSELNELLLTVEDKESVLKATVETLLDNKFSDRDYKSEKDEISRAIPRRP